MSHSLYASSSSAGFVLGTGGSFARLDGREQRRALDAFLGAGQRWIDTAPSYSEGEAERALGRLITAPQRLDVHLITKVWHERPGSDRPFDVDSIRHEICQSLDRLRTDHVDSILLHRDPGCPPAQLAEVMSEACADLAKSWGTSNVAADRLAAIAGAMSSAGPTVNSAQLSIIPLHQPLYAGTTVYSHEMEDVHRSLQLPLLAWGAQTRGWLSGRSEFETKKFESPSNRLLRRRVHEVAARSACSPEAVALQWILERDVPSVPIVGVSAGSGLENALAAIKRPVSRSDMDALSVLRARGAVP